VRPLVTPEIAGLRPYEPGKSLDELQRELGTAWPAGGAIKLASNENPLGPSPRAVEAATHALAQVHRYPDGAAFELRQRLAARLGVAPEQVVLGAGSNELIDLVVKAFCAPDEEVLAPEASFISFALAAAGHRRAFRATPNGARFAYDLPSLAAAAGAKTKVVFLANPNNPTGAWAGRAALAELAVALPPEVLLVVDEAYFEYVRAPDYASALTLLSARPRLIVLRTFSKVYGLAGLRVGLAVASPEIADFLDRVRLPFNVGQVAQAAALAALDDIEHVARSQRSNAAGLEQLTVGLGALGLQVFPSQGNFVLVELDADGPAVYRALLSRGVIVRPLVPYGLTRHLRITVGTEAENARLLSALAEVK
jgi:histidinol-phosphate aminotransferase